LDALKAIARKRQNLKCTAMSRGRFCRDQCNRTEARDLLAPICGWFTEGFDTPVLQEAKTLPDQLT
jgi:hypothetical protein